MAMLVVNFKTYENGTGNKALELAKICDRVSKKVGKEIILSVQPFDLYRISHSVDIPVFAQHLDPINYGHHTGWLLPEGARQNGAVGTIINHSEKKIPMEEIEKIVKKCKEIGLKTIVCASNPEEASKIDKFSPDYIAVEPPELIGTGVSVSESEPRLITETLNAIKTPLLCGAGISTGKDVKKAIELGAVGVLVASGIVEVDNQEEKIIELASSI